MGVCILKFDVVIGNPPYNRGLDIDFTRLGTLLSSKYTVMITPAKWESAEAEQKIASTRMDYGWFRRFVVPYMREIVFYPCSKDVFDIYQVDGITYYIIDKQIHDIKKITNISSIDIFNSTEYRSISNGESLYNVCNNVITYLGDYETFKFPWYSGMCRYEIWMNTKISGFDWFNTNKPRLLLNACEIIDTENEEKPTGEKKCIFESDSIDECKSFLSWIYSKFTRFFVMANISKLNNILTDHYFRFVPAPPNNKFDHIFSDDELYKYYDIGQKDIDIIERLFKARVVI